MHISDWLSPGKTAAVNLTFDVDAETGPLSASRAFAGNPMKITHQTYDPDVGVPRIMGILDDLRVPATFFFPGWVAEQRPALVTTIAEAGYEIGHHSYSHVSASEMTEDEERHDFERAMKVFEKIGVPIYGHRAGRWDPSWRTPALVAEYGLLYDSSLMNDDRPFHIETENGSLVELPPYWSLDDWPQYGYLPGRQTISIEDPLKVLRMWKYELDAMRRYHTLFMLTCHPALTGRPGRAESLRSLIEYGLECGDVEFDTCLGVARRAAVDRSLPTRHLIEPTVEAGVFPEP